MANGKETGVSLEDAQNAAESLFGDTAAVPIVEVDPEEATEQETAPDGQSSEVVAKEQTGGDETAPAKNETDQVQQGSEVGQEHAGEVETDATEKLKVVVTVRDSRATIGVQRPSSDPHIESFDDPNLSGLAQQISAVLERARARWEGAPKHPAYARPTASTGRRPQREQGAAQNSTIEEGPDQQQPETLRLF